MQNGRHSLDLTDFIEPAHIKTPSATFDLPMDISLPTQARIQKLGARMQETDVSDSEYETMEIDLWRMADKLLENAIPHPGPARDVIGTLPALFSLIAFLTQGYRSLQESSVPSPSPTPTTEPSNSETSLSQVPS